MQVRQTPEPPPLPFLQEQGHLVLIQASPGQLAATGPIHVHQRGETRWPATSVEHQNRLPELQQGGRRPQPLLHLRQITDVRALALELQQLMNPLPAHPRQPLPLGGRGAVHIQLHPQLGGPLHADAIRQGQPWILVKFQGQQFQLHRLPVVVSPRRRSNCRSSGRMPWQVTRSLKQTTG